MKKLTRRWTLLSFGALLGLAAYPFYSVLNNRPEDLVESIIRKRLAGYNLDIQSLTAFSKEFAHTSIFREAQFKALVYLKKVYESSEVLKHTPLRNALWHLERVTVEGYLLNSNFFYYKDDIDRQKHKIIYLFSFSGNKVPCGNPFARFG